jgi:hypothetical protein
MSTLAVVFAVGAALMSMASTRLIPGYEFVGGPVPQCIQKSDICDVTGNWDCKVNTSSPILRDQNTPSTSCGTNLKRHTAPPAP